MSATDHIWDKLDTVYSRWRLREIPFSESATTFGKAQLQEVFTGRENELREVLSLFKSRERKRILVHGLLGIGKTAFMLEVLGVLQRKAKDTLVTFISLPPEIDLATAALIALARKMEDDEWAQHQRNHMGLRPGKTAYKRNRADVVRAVKRCATLAQSVRKLCAA